MRRFAAAELPAVARELEARDTSLPDEWMKRYAELGVLGINIPEAYGGQGLGHFEAVLALEEFAKISSAVAMPVFEANFGPMAVLAHFASEEMKRRLLPRVCRGELIIAVSMSDQAKQLTDLATRAYDAAPGSERHRWCSGAGHVQGDFVARLPMHRARPASVPCTWRRARPA
jgi:butyryl-CoA dehydrogenase